MAVVREIRDRTRQEALGASWRGRWVSRQWRRVPSGWQGAQSGPRSNWASRPLSRVRRRAERVSRPAREKNRRRRVLVLLSAMRAVQREVVGGWTARLGRPPATPEGEMVETHFVQFWIRLCRVEDGVAAEGGDGQFLSVQRWSLPARTGRWTCSFGGHSSVPLHSRISMQAYLPDDSRTAVTKTGSDSPDPANRSSLRILAFGVSRLFIAGCHRRHEVPGSRRSFPVSRTDFRCGFL